MKIVYMIWLLSIGILPFLQGGYFYHEGLFFGAIQGIVLLFILFKSHIANKLTGFRWMYLLIIISSFLSTITAVDQGMHMVGVLKLIVPFLVILNLDSFYQLYPKKMIIHLKSLYIVVSLIMVSLLIVVLLFFDSSHGLFEYFVQGTRIGGFFQYANTFGMFIYGSLIIVFSSSINKWVKLPVSILLVSGIMLTQSRGILLILIASLILFAIVNAKGLRLLYVSSLLGIGSGQALLWWIKDHVDVFRGVALLENRSEWLIRLLYYEDSLPMIIKRLTGYGHLGYYYTHQFYQSGASYKVKFLHNSLLQITLDYGLVAGIALLLIGIYSCVLIYRQYTKTKFVNVRDEGVILLVAGLGLFAHTMVDFDFQFTAFMVMYVVILFMVEHKYIENVKEIYVLDVVAWMKVKIFRRNNVDSSKKSKEKNKILRWMNIVMILVLTSLFVYIGSVSYLDYEGESGKAYNMYPYFTDSVDKLLKGKSISETLTDEEKLEISLAAIEQNPYYLNGFAFLRDYYYNNGDLESASMYAKEVYTLAPLRLDYYEIYTKISIEYILRLYQSKNLDKSNEYLLSLLTINDYVKELELQRSNTYNVKHKVEFIVTQDMVTIENKASEIYNTIQE